MLSLPNDRWAVLKERFKNITLLGLAGPAAETWWQVSTDRSAHVAAEMWAGRDYDLYIERTAWIVPTILGVVDGVSSTLIHLTTGPDGYEALVWRRGNRAGPRRLIFESSGSSHVEVDRTIESTHRDVR